MHAPMTTEELADLLAETGHRHHQAYAESGGVDPEWPLWYAGYLQAKLWDRAGGVPTRSSLVHLLVQAESDFAEMSQPPAWALAYAKSVLGNLRVRS